jgi:hypothetical protein
MRTDSIHADSVSSEVVRVRGLATKFLESVEPGIRGQNARADLFITAAKAIKFCIASGVYLSEAEVFTLMRDCYNPRCEPPWDMDGLLEIVHDAYEYVRLKCR